MKKLCLFLVFCLSNIGWMALAQAGNSSSKGIPSGESQEERLEDDADGNQISDNASAAHDSAADDSAAAVPAKLSVKERARRIQEAANASGTPERKPLRSAANLSPADVEGVGAGIVKGPLAGDGLIKRRKALKKELEEKKAFFAHEEAIKKAELASVEGGLGIAGALDAIWGGKKAAFKSWREEQMHQIQLLSQQLDDIHSEIEARGIKG